LASLSDAGAELQRLRENLEQATEQANRAAKLRQELRHSRTELKQFGRAVAVFRREIGELRHRGESLTKELKEVALAHEELTAEFAKAHERETSIRRLVAAILDELNGTGGPAERGRYARAVASLAAVTGSVAADINVAE
jgi:chromosome segregation ATPase